MPRRRSQAEQNFSCGSNKWPPSRADRDDPTCWLRGAIDPKATESLAPCVALANCARPQCDIAIILSWRHASEAGSVSILSQARSHHHRNLPR